MAEELNDADYAAMLAGGNVSLAWHSIDRSDFGYESINKAMTEAVYRAVKQVFSDRLQIELPAEMPALFPEEST